MSEGVSGAAGRPSHEGDKAQYEKEYKKGTELFEQALDNYGKSDNTFQKEEFRGVMDKAMNILNDSARGLVRKDLEEKNKQIRKDYEQFQKFPKDQDSVDKLKKDLDDAKSSCDHS